MLISHVAFLLIAFVALFMPAFATTQAKVHTLYNSLDPKSITKHLAFYYLYGNSHEGKLALTHIMRLLGENHPKQEHFKAIAPFTFTSANALDFALSSEKNHHLEAMDDFGCDFISEMGSVLHNRSLKGCTATCEEDVLNLESCDIDLARGLFLAQVGSDASALDQIRHYEAIIDLMAMQVKAKLKTNATDKEIIAAMSRYIFHELQYRFPPHSFYAKNIDLYTFLPSVIDSRKGVCLGVSILYLCLAQRLGVELDIITPPGHIFVAYSKGKNTINIETTARGVHVDTEEYLGIETPKLQKRTIKETIGLAFINEASIYWKTHEYQKSLDAYKHAEKYLTDDPLLKVLMGFNYLFVGDEERGKILLKESLEMENPYQIKQDYLILDYLEGKVDVEGIKAIFESVDETKESIRKKKDLLEDQLKKFPHFRTGYFAYATCWLQLNRHGEALDALIKYHNLIPDDPTAEYYLSVIHFMRLDYNKAWKHYKNCMKILLEKGHHPKALVQLGRELRKHVL